MSATKPAPELVVKLKKLVTASPPIRKTKELAAALNIDAGELKDRVKRWRKANPELYRERQRAYAQAWRARKKEAKE